MSHLAKPASFWPRKRPSIPRAFAAFLVALGRIAFGALLCFHYLTSIIVVGWTFRLMRRRILIGFWKASPARDDIPFESFAEHCLDIDVPLAPFRVGSPLNDSSIGSHAPSRTADRPASFGNCFEFRGALGGLALNIKTGVVALVCTYILTGPACLLWLGSWYDGWNNSFNKGYEQAYIGPLTGILGIALFITAMLHVPLAWAHLAATGDARVFFSFGFIRKLARSKPLGTVLLALCVSLATLPITITRRRRRFS